MSRPRKNSGVPTVEQILDSAAYQNAKAEYRELYPAGFEGEETGPAWHPYRILTEQTIHLRDAHRIAAAGEKVDWLQYGRLYEAMQLLATDGDAAAQAWLEAGTAMVSE